MKEKPKGTTPQTRVWTPGSGVRPHPAGGGGSRPYPDGSRPVPSRSNEPRSGEPYSGDSRGSGGRAPAYSRDNAGRPPARPRPDRPDRPDRGERGDRRGFSKKPRMSPQERRTKREGFGRLYMDKQLREKTPMVFVTYDGSVRGTLHKRLVYDLDINSAGEKVRINKLQIKFCYKAADEETISKFLAVDEGVLAQNLPPVKPRKERFQMDTRHLAVARQKKLPLKIVLRGGESFTGNIDWYSHYEIKMSLGGEEGSVVVFRHAAFTYEVIGAPPLRDAPYRRPMERSRPPVQKNAYPARRREE